jgi:hypothetical protein
MAEEVLTDQFDATKDRSVTNQMIRAMLRLYPLWMEHALNDLLVRIRMKNRK